MCAEDTLEDTITKGA